MGEDDEWVWTVARCRSRAGCPRGVPDGRQEGPGGLARHPVPRRRGASGVDEGHCRGCHRRSSRRRRSGRRPLGVPWRRAKSQRQPRPATPFDGSPPFAPSLPNDKPSSHKARPEPESEPAIGSVRPLRQCPQNIGRPRQGAPGRAPPAVCAPGRTRTCATGSGGPFGLSRPSSPSDALLPGRESSPVDSPDVFPRIVHLIANSDCQTGRQPPNSLILHVIHSRARCPPIPLGVGHSATVLTPNRICHCFLPFASAETPVALDVGLSGQGRQRQRCSERCRAGTRRCLDVQTVANQWMSTTVCS